MSDCKVYFGQVPGKKGLRVLINDQEINPKPFSRRRFESLEVNIKDHPPEEIITNWLGVTVTESRR